ncbi:hypothetical protein ES703_11784 [subsurface metagenome]
MNTKINDKKIVKKMKSLHKLIIAVYFAIWSIVFYYLLGNYVNFQTITGNTVEDLTKIYTFSIGISNWLNLFVPFMMIHSLVFVILFLVNVIVERKVERATQAQLK